LLIRKIPEKDFTYHLMRVKRKDSNDDKGDDDKRDDDKRDSLYSKRSYLNYS